MAAKRLHGSIHSGFGRKPETESNPRKPMILRLGSTDFGFIFHFIILPTDKGGAAATCRPESKSKEGLATYGVGWLCLR